MAQKNNVTFYELRVFFGVEKRFVKAGMKKGIDFDKLYAVATSNETYGHKRNYMYEVFRNCDIQENLIDTFWSRYVRLQTIRDEQEQIRSYAKSKIEKIKKEKKEGRIT